MTQPQHTVTKEKIYLIRNHKTPQVGQITWRVYCPQIKIELFA